MATTMTTTPVPTASTIPAKEYRARSAPMTVAPMRPFQGRYEPRKRLPWPAVWSGVARGE